MDMGVASTRGASCTSSHSLLLSIASFTRGVERFSANENFGKILKVSYFYLGFSLDENHNGIKHSLSILSEFLDSYRVLSKFLKSDSENSNETFENV